MWCAAMLGLSLTAGAQMSGPPPAPPIGTHEDPSYAMPIDGFSTRAAIAAFAAAHANDHYGRMVEYLRMNAVVPPASAK